MSDTLCDVRQEQYPMVIREMIRHENDVTNHRIMWLLIGQGFIANAYVSSAAKGSSDVSMLALTGILVTLSAFLMLYKSHQARGYLQFLGQQAKRGLLREEQLPLSGWPKDRIKGWSKQVWICPWIGTPLDLLEPWLFLPYLFLSAWTLALLNSRSTLDTETQVTLSAVLSAATIAVCCVLLVWSQGKDEKPA